MNDIEYMELALSEASKGIGWVNPNPLVGAVIVKDEKVIATGYHTKYGCLHAEREALANCLQSVQGATMYVTLEPCCHYGKTPPCTQAIIESGIKKVFVGCVDPNPLVAGKGIDKLKQAGIEVIVGLLEEQCRRQNEVFFHYIKTKRPFVAMKYAMTLDGKIATVTGESQWITSEQSRMQVHEMRHKYSAIMVGIGTVLADNPMLNYRNNANGKNPIRIICDTQLTTPITSKIVKTAKEQRVIIATNNNDTTKHKLYTHLGCEILVVGLTDNKINLNELMEKLAAIGIDSILLEGGAQLNFSAIKARIVNSVTTYIAPKIFGGTLAKTPVGGDGFANINNAIQLKYKNVTALSNGDILIESDVLYS
ncbi:MAG: riboflavin biosynthesis protein RibD [Epulopiscium sp. Nuni2H_MBin001]|nr:MAG: riboflavin biosynthesis protein RibD [Epulopiscium sp. Nuni2H_MBin001]